jgi:hypothetical protein
VSAKTQENDMERELFFRIKERLRRLGKRRTDPRQLYTDATIVEVYHWAVLNDRPTVWACDPGNWPPGLRRGPLPSQSAMSRRLRSGRVMRLLQRLEELLLRRHRPPPLVYIVDGKPLPIAGHSTDRQAGYGRAAGGKAKGYKLHALIDIAGTVWAWRIAPMNADERTMALRLSRDLPGEGYLLADANYDSNRLYGRVALRGVQAIIPRRYGPGHGVARRAQHPTRLRSRDMLENGVSRFGQDLHRLRRCIECFFGTLVATGGGLNGLPAWVRTHRRVKLWVQAKLLFNQLRADRRSTPNTHS